MKGICTEIRTEVEYEIMRRNIKFISLVLTTETLGRKYVLYTHNTSPIGFCTLSHEDIEIKRRLS